MEYSELIRRLLDADQAAQNIAQEVKGREQGIEDELAKESANLRDSLFAKAEEQLQAKAAQINLEKEKALAGQDERRDEAMRRMERARERYGDNWVDTLFHRIVDDQA